MKKKIYFLGYRNSKTKIINFLRKKNFAVIEYKQKILANNIAKKADLIISFGYRKIIKKNILKLTKRPIINLHISYLPFNRGAHPNFWSFIDNTPKGVSIHKTSKIIDGGNILFRKRIHFKNEQYLTFKKTYLKLIKEIEKLFISKFDKILNNDYVIIKTKSKGSFHYSKDLPKNLKNWIQI